jgi:hypothetical protein
MKSVSLTFPILCFDVTTRIVFLSTYFFYSHAVKADTAPAKTFSCASMSPK